jgi:hypothetical protein
MVDTTRPSLVLDRNDSAVQAFPLDFANGQRLAIGGTSVRSAQIDTSTLIFLKASSRCHVRVGDVTVVATSTAGTSWPVAADETFALPIAPGQYVAVIQDSAAGFLVIMPALAG